ncbi:hypothetical protein GCM10023194_57170 [Planotetraspora phitsanulokensis]|uniref:Uncharacterized protein n=2 Tax=Planotetraspora phitsanulokensis TaxID=575192 RepID=A0A8J3UCQ8_9ACTN|nr:hypothetical protein Pph01_80770 [Planotetraspora phitsanulokensis]
MSATEFTIRTGISPGALNDQLPPESISLALITRISAALNMSPAELLIPELGGTALPPQDDDLMLEAALACHGELADNELVDALGWSPQRLRGAAKRLADRLCSTSLQLVQVDNRLRLECRAGVLPPKAEIVLSTAKQAQIPPTPREAAVLLRLIHEERDAGGVALHSGIAFQWEISHILMRRLMATTRKPLEVTETSDSRYRLAPHPDTIFGLCIGTLPD